MTINLSKVQSILDDAVLLTEDLDGQDLDERLTSPGEARDRRVQKSRDLQRLAQQLDLAAELVRNEYWFARGGSDPIYGREHP